MHGAKKFSRTGSAHIPPILARRRPPHIVRDARTRVATIENAFRNQNRNRGSKPYLSARFSLLSRPLKSSPPLKI